ncbi:MAG: hypothetical protein CVU05_05525 [Bacteroidetes bacterium HGW-Bacteroidetes-21]|nr:MAG: hypothetical protein CVU05_05525 [Bacteroidetes bacterium HGW-Bacteroidetes-21]
MASKPIYNKLITGLVLGIVIPSICVMLFYLVRHPAKSFYEFLVLVTQMNVMSPILSLCALPNLGIFYLFLNKEWWYSARGVILATLLWAVLVFLVKFVL